MRYEQTVLSSIITLNSITTDFLCFSPNLFLKYPNLVGKPLVRLNGYLVQIIANAFSHQRFLGYFISSSEREIKNIAKM